jgi:hypothetical protein
MSMQKHKMAQEGRVELNIGGYHFQTSVQTLRRVPHTFFDAYFSGRFAQDVSNDGSIFVDRDGEHFGHILAYMRDGTVSVAEPSARPSVSLLRALKCEFGFYCIALCTARGGICDGWTWPWCGPVEHGAVRCVIGAVERGGSYEKCMGL